MIWPSSRKIPGMDSQTKTLIQLNAPQLLYLWRLAWLCQIAAYVQQQSTKPTTYRAKTASREKISRTGMHQGKTVCNCLLHQEKMVIGTTMHVKCTHLRKWG
ncbi:hypothetical protein, partial [Thiolapillus sp.]